MGLRSGDCVGQTRTWVLLSSNHCVALFEVFGVIVLLKNPLFLLHLQIFKALHQSILQNLTVLLCIYDPLNLCKIFYSIPPHTTPYHEVISSSMLDCDSPLSFQVYILLSDPILFIFVSSDYKTIFQSSTVQFW